jgi:hypothetical protein
MKLNKTYIYKEFSFWIFRFSFCKLKNKFCIRFEIAKGW